MSAQKLKSGKWRARVYSHTDNEGKKHYKSFTSSSKKEAERMEKYLKDGAFVCALAIDGVQLDSVSLSEKIERLGTEGNSHIIFMIGGSLGMSDTLLKRADMKLSFSKMTFPHQLMRVILLEQIYRSYRIMNKEPYHK